MRKTLTSMLVIGALTVGAPVLAQEFPSGPIEVINNSKPGGGTDVFLRFATENVGDILGTDMVIQSKTGGVATNALNYVDSRERDGHTVFSLLPGHLLTIVRGKVDVAFEDIIPLVRGTIDPEFLVVKTGSYADLDAFVDAAASGSIKQGGTGVGGNAHVASLVMANKLGMTKQTYIPFDKSGEIALNLASGRINVALLNFSEFESMMGAGELTPLAVLHDERLKNAPDVPTAIELGYDLKLATVRGLGVLKGTPEPIIAKLEAAFLESMNSKEYLDYLAGSGQGPDSVAGREEWTAMIKEMNESYLAIAKQVSLIKK